MYLVRTKSGDKILETANEVKNINKSEIIQMYSLSEVEYDSIISNSDIRDCIYSCLKGDQKLKEDVLDFVSGTLDVKKSEVSKVITAMKKEKIIYTVADFGWIGID